MIPDGVRSQPPARLAPLTPFDPSLLDERIAWEDRRAAGETPGPDWSADLQAGGELQDLFRGADLVETLLDDLAPTPASAAPSVPGFLLHTPLGYGGMGEVWLGEDRALGRQVAVKFPLKRLAPGQLAARFEREGRALGRLRHANIVAVHYAGVSGGRPFLVMDYVPGGSLEEVIDELPNEPARAAALLAAAAAGVQHAHEAGVFHRDLKPANLLLDPTDLVRVSDFGIAAILADIDPTAAGNQPAGPLAGDTFNDLSRLTRTDSVVGTPAYSAPETHRAPTAPPRPESDVWSLGVILYRAVTGVLPFDGRTAAVRDAVRRADPLSPRALNPAVPRWLEAAILRCLAKAPEARFRTAGQLADALRAGPVVARRRRRFRERVLLGMAALAASAAVALAVLPEDPDRRHARVSARIARDLAKPKAVDLVPRGEMPLTYKAVVNPHLLTVTRTDEGVLFDAHGPVFVELLAETPEAGYQLEWTLRQIYPNDVTADAGVYVCGEVAAPGVRDFIALRFSDFGNLATCFRGPLGQAGAADQLVFFRHTVHSPVKSVGDLDSWSDHKFGLTHWRPQRNDLRTIRLEVGGDSVRCWADGFAFPTLPLDRVRTGSSEPNRLPASMKGTGGVGLYLQQCGLLVRTCQLSPNASSK